MSTTNAFALLDDDYTPPVVKKTPVVEAPPAKKPERAPRENKREGDRPRGRGRGGGRGRGRGARDGEQRERRPRGDGERREKREFDRHESGTGRSRGDKKAGAGKGNWGSEQGEIKDGQERRRRFDRRDRNKAPAASTEDKAAVEGEEKPAEGEEAEKTEDKTEDAAPVEPEEVALTYDEFRAQQAAAAVAADKEIQLREVSNDDSAFKAVGTYTKPEEVNEWAFEYRVAKTTKTKKGPKGKAGKISLDEFAAAPKKGGRGQGRGQGRGPRQGGNTRGGKFTMSNDAFPTLGGK